MFAKRRGCAPIQEPDTSSGIQPITQNPKSSPHPKTQNQKKGGNGGGSGTEADISEKELEMQTRYFKELNDKMRLQVTTRVDVLILALIYRDTSLIRKRAPLGPYRGPMPRDLEGS